MEYYSAIKRGKIELIVVWWMNLESVIQSDISPKEKYIIYYYIYKKFRKWYQWTYFQDRKRDEDRESELVDTVGEGEGGTTKRKHWCILNAMC